MSDPVEPLLPDNENRAADAARDLRPEPNPHRGEAAPRSMEGLRPEADPSLIRPAEEEENPLGGLLHASAVEAQQEVANTSANADEAARLGVEEEGVESSQIFVLGLTVLLSVLSAALFVYYLFYLPTREQSRDGAEAVPGDRYVELRETRAEGLERIGDYATNADSTFRIPIDAAMAQVAQDYAGLPNAQAAVRPPVTPNLDWVILLPPPAVRAAGSISPARPDSVSGVGQGAVPSATGSTSDEGPTGGLASPNAAGAAPAETGRTEQEGGNQPSLPAQRGTRSETQSVLDPSNP